MASETIERNEEFDVEDVSYTAAIDRTVAAVCDRYDVSRILVVRASCENSDHQWWTSVKAEINVPEEDADGE